MRVYALLPMLGLLLSDPTASASATSEPRQDQIVEASSTSRDHFYDVRGDTADAVFSSIGKKGLGNTPGRAASGLTESKLSYSLESTYGGNKPCRILSLQLRLDIVVTLPRHASPNTLSANARRNWEIYATAVEAHEYRHVEIELRGLEELSTRLHRSIREGRITAPGKSACANYVDELLSQQRTLTRSRHEEFHRESGTRKAGSPLVRGGGDSIRSRHPRRYGRIILPGHDAARRSRVSLVDGAGHVSGRHRRVWPSARCVVT